MSSTDPARSELQEEARSAVTSAARLEVLLRQDPALAPIIAVNPSASWKLLDRLALKHPVEILANPLLTLRVLEAERAYREFSLPALVSLCLVSEQPLHSDLLNETRERLFANIKKFEGDHTATLTCI